MYIPKVFNTDKKKKLFFFFSQEYTRQKPATLSGYANMPTAAQRASPGSSGSAATPVALVTTIQSKPSNAAASTGIGAVVTVGTG